jgi:hypothetical protein
VSVPFEYGNSVLDFDLIAAKMPHDSPPQRQQSEGRQAGRQGHEDLATQGRGFAWERGIEAGAGGSKIGKTLGSCLYSPFTACYDSGKMKEKFPAVADEYRRYRIMLGDYKEAVTNPIQTSPTSGGHPTEIGKSALRHPDPFDGLEFQIVIKPQFVGDYEIKIFWREVAQRPVFRFESWGDGHINPEDGRGLPFRKIPTPHFHMVKEDGRMWAFRTALLDDPEQEKEILRHYSVGVNHFCQEAKIHDPDGGNLHVIMLNSLSGLSNSHDPLEGVTF